MQGRRGDPDDDFVKWDLDYYRWLETRPKCCACDEPIQDEYGYKIIGEWYCEDCMNREFRKYIEEEVD